MLWSSISKSSLLIYLACYWLYRIGGWFSVFPINWVGTESSYHLKLPMYKYFSSGQICSYKHRRREEIGEQAYSLWYIFVKTITKFSEVRERVLGKLSRKQIFADFSRENRILCAFSLSFRFCEKGHVWLMWTLNVENCSVYRTKVLGQKIKVKLDCTVKVYGASEREANVVFTL